MSKIKYLNCYAGIGGNVRLLDRGEVEITAIEINPNIAAVYSELYPNDNVIVGDAHEYLLRHIREFDFVWASPPCVTHSHLAFYFNHHRPERIKYPDMSLYQEIILLKKFYKGKFVIENVKPYYQPLIPPDFELDRHLFWASDFIFGNELFLQQKGNLNFIKLKDNSKLMAEIYGYDISQLRKKNIDISRCLRNCVIPEIGEMIFKKIMRGM